MPTTEDLTWGEAKGKIQAEVINQMPDGLVKTAAQEFWDKFVGKVGGGHDNTVLFGPFIVYTPEELANLAKAAADQAVADALNAVFGNFFSFVSQAAQTTEMTVSGSVFYPVTFAGVNPVVGARIKIYPLDPATLLHAALSDVTPGAPIAQSATDYQGRYYVTMNFGPGDGLYLAHVSNGDDVNNPDHEGVFPLVFNAITAEFFPVIVARDWLDVGGWVLGYRRKNVDFHGDMSPAQAIELADAIFKVVTEKLVRSHMQQIDHIEYFFIDHKTYIWQLEKKLLKDPIINTLDCVPCPEYQPYSNIPGLAARPDRAPTGFFQVLPLADYDIWGVNGYINPLYNDLWVGLRPLVPDELTPANVDKFKTADQLAKYIGRSAASARTSFHFNAHAAMMGPFANMMTAAGATIFWPVHGLMVDIYDEWVSRQFGKNHGPYQLGSRSQNITDPDHPRWHYTELFTITGKNEIWHCYQRHVIYQRHDRPFDPVFDHADIAACNPLDEDHDKTDESWVHYSHWENRTIGWQWDMAGHGHQTPVSGHAGRGISQPITGVGAHGDGHDDDHSHEPRKQLKVRGAALSRPIARKRAKNTGRASTRHDLRALSKAVPLANPLAKYLDGLWSASAAGPPLEEKAVTLIDCAAVSLKTTTDRVTGRVILLAKDTQGKLCLLRPVMDDCDECVATKFTCHHLPFGEVEDYDLCMKADGTLRIAYIPARSGLLTVRAESGYNRNDFDDIVYHKQLSWALFQVELVKDRDGFVHAFSSNQHPIADIPDSKPRPPSQHLPCAREGTLFHSYELSIGDWDTDRHPVSKDCITSFAVVLDKRAGAHVFRVAAIDLDGKIAVASVPAGDQSPSAPPYLWEAISQPDTGFFYLCATSHKDGTPQLFAIDSTGVVWQSKKIAGTAWANMARIDQRPIMGHRHRGILAELDYTGCIKIFVHADDNFAYTCEQEQPNGDTYIGWMNV